MKGVVARARTAIVERLPRRTTPIDTLALLSALPVPVVLLDASNGFRYANQAAEHFFGQSMLQLGQIELSALLPPDNPLFQIIAQVRASENTISDYDLNLESPRLQKRHISINVTSLPGGAWLRVADAAGCVGSACARPADRLSRRGAQRQRHGGDPGARGAQPALGHPRRRAIAGAQRAAG